MNAQRRGQHVAAHMLALAACMWQLAQEKLSWPRRE